MANAIISRRGFLSGILIAATAPAIVSFANIMPVKVMPSAVDLQAIDFSDIVVATLRARCKQLAANVTANNALLARIRSKSLRFHGVELEMDDHAYAA